MKNTSKKSILSIKPEFRKLLQNFFSLSSIQLVNVILPLFTLPYVLRVISYEKYGIIMFAVALTTYFQSITDYSFKITGTRDVALHSSNSRKVNLIYSRIMIIKFIFLLASIGINTAIIFLYPPFYEDRLIFILACSSLIGYSIFPEWFFHGTENMKMISYINISTKIISTVLIFVLIKEPDDFWIYPLLQSASLFVNGVVGQLLLIFKYNVKFYWLKWRTIWGGIKANFPIFINQFAPNLYNNTNSLLLGLFATTELVGVYNAIKKVIDVFTLLLSLISRVFFPVLNRKKEMFKKYLLIIMVTTIVGCIGIFLGQSLIFWYLDLEHSAAGTTLTILTIGIIGYALYDVFGLNYFIVRRQDKLVMKNTLLASFIGFVLAFPLIYFGSIVGASINLSVSRWLMGGRLSFLFIKSREKGKIST